MAISLDVFTLQGADPTFPRRSHLYCLEPIGIGTPDVEQLTSYIQRLALVHGVKTKTFVERTLVPLLIKGPMRSSSYRPSFLNQAFPLNGHGSVAENWVAVFETLTLRHDLHNLTMLRWAHVISIRGLLRCSRAWCSACLEEMRVQKVIVYEPLLWALEIVTVCLKHEQRLSDICPSCKQIVPTLSNNACPGYCSKCQQWLGIQVGIGDEAARMINSEERSWQQFVRQALGDMLAQAPTSGLVPEAASIVHALRKCIDQVTGGNVAAFSRYIGVDHSVVRYWLSGENILSLHLLLKVCYYLDRKPLEFLTLEGVTELE